MKVKIRDISNDFCEFWDKSKGKSYNEKVKIWKSVYEEPNRDVFDKHLSLARIFKKDFNLEDRYEHSFKKYENCINKVKSINENIEEKIMETCNACMKLFDIGNDSDLELCFVTMVGLYLADGWVSDFKGRPTTFFAMEYMPKPENVNIFLAHEITHCIHNNISEFGNDLTLAERIFIEGFAVTASKKLCEGRDTYVYIGKSNEWLIRSMESWEYAKQDVIDNLGNKTDEYTSKYFMGEDNKSLKIPARSGYTYGYFLVNKLLEKYTFHEMIKWKSERIIKEVNKEIINLELKLKK